jgi:outer membrane protein OmpA-like peptidoglycan-associated protein
MKTIGALAVTLPLLAATAACAGPQNSTGALNSARQAYTTASQGPAPQYAPDSLAVARDSLGRAERANSMSDTHAVSFAALARSRAQVADASGHTALAVQERDASRTRLAQAQAQTAVRAAAECQGQQGVTAAQPSSDALAAIADQKVQAQGATVYLISSGLEFQKNEATLSAEAKNKLDKIADALKSEPQNTLVTIEGFTDPTGGPTINDPLSERRARAVASYLERRGIPQHVDTRGRGATQPVGDNATREGREQNRRAVVMIRLR